MKKNTILLLLDAFRWDYICENKTPYLKNLSNNNYHIEKVIPSYGFCERTEILTGNNSQKSGYVSAYKPKLKKIKKVNFILKYLQKIEGLISSNLIRKIIRKIVGKIFLKLYSLPIQKIPYELKSIRSIL